MLLCFLLLSGVAIAASQSCQNTAPLCGASPGWPLLSMCQDHDYVFASCPEFCGQCSCTNDPRGPCYNGGTRGGNPANYNEHTCDCNCVGAWTGDLCQYCSLTCVHGTLDSNTCTCVCSPGWDGPTCSDVCADSSALCGANPGWPTVASCSVDYVAESCHLFCGVCSGGSGVVTQPTTTTQTTTTTTPQPTCPNGYALIVNRGVCLKAFNDERTWSEAAAVCEQNGGLLAMPKDEEMHQACVALKNNINSGVNFWIGLTDAQTEGQWRYVDGSGITSFNKWNPGEPNNLSTENCAHYYPQNTWNDLSCGTRMRFICQTVPR
ncbi:COLEC11 [Branchiostoma lanceolatum]|uniref:COLEC11 protein n=1 Tax=Branchiostoma lanceolatum TaxID=7740 RepID=A0A8J9YN37_BRALA|nr:COLEC11 [Branchiostoma lanceolatum]